MSAIILPFPAKARFTQADRNAIIAATARLPGAHTVVFEVDEAGNAWATVGPAGGDSVWAGLFDAFLIGWEGGRLVLTDVPSGQALGRFRTAVDLCAAMLAQPAPLLTAIQVPGTAAPLNR